MGLPDYLPLTERKTDIFMPFQRLEAWNEGQGASSRIWTRVADSISYDDNRYAITITVTLLK